MAITQCVVTSFKTELFTATHDFSASGGHSFKLALYTSSATLGASTTAYTATNEVSGTGYSAGGVALTNIEPTSSGTVSYIDFADAAWAASSITARGGLIYNTSSSNAAVAVLDFGADKTSSASTFTVIFPAATPTSAIIRIS